MIQPGILSLKNLCSYTVLISIVLHLLLLHLAVSHNHSAGSQDARLYNQLLNAEIICHKQIGLQGFRVADQHRVVTEKQGTSRPKSSTNNEGNLLHKPIAL